MQVNCFKLQTSRNGYFRLRTLIFAHRSHERCTAVFPYLHLQYIAFAVLRTHYKQSIYYEMSVRFFRWSAFFSQEAKNARRNPVRGVASAWVRVSVGVVLGWVDALRILYKQTSLKYEPPPPSKLVLVICFHCVFGIAFRPSPLFFVAGFMRIMPLFTFLLLLSVRDQTQGSSSSLASSASD